MNSPIQHQKSVEHCPCHYCVRLDRYIMLLEAQLPPLDCPECKQSFSQKASLENYQREELHASCSDCSVVFPTRDRCVSHMQSHAPTLVRPQSPATQFRCCDCQRDFGSEVALTDHLRYNKVHRPGRGGQKGKKKKKEHKQREQGTPQPECKQCNRTFNHHDALKSHLSSVRHHPLSDIQCLADKNCSKRFSCPSGQLHHLESGKCQSGMTKTKLNRGIAAKDTGHVITSGVVMAQQLLGENLASSASSTSRTWSTIITPTSTEFLGSYPPSLPSLALTPESTLSPSANFHSILAHRLRSGFHTCHLCPPTRTRLFKIAALQQHLSSGVHAQSSISLPDLDNLSFHCPRILMGEEGQKRPLKQFSTVSGLAQHLESGACDGGGTGILRRVIEYVQEEMKDMGFGGLKLLS